MVASLLLVLFFRVFFFLQLTQSFLLSLHSTPKQILQVTAIDLDTGNNARLTYRIVSQQQKQPNNHTTNNSNEASEAFAIFPNNGWIYLRAALDRETYDRYVITVLASDNGTPSATATTHVIINIDDSNDNDPEFGRDSYQFSVEENLRRGVVVGTVSATDADLDANAVLRYNLLPSNTSFQINSVTGRFLIFLLT